MKNMIIAMIILSLNLFSIVVYADTPVATKAAATATVLPSIKWKPYAVSVFEEAKKSQHPVILFAKSNECQWCLKMEKTTLNDNALIKTINDNYTPVILDIDDHFDIANQYNIMDLPTIIVFDINGKVVKVMSGYMDVKQVTTELKNTGKNKV